MSVFRYRPEIDGLRAVAVIIVLLFHAGLGFPGGYVGVDVFFVISGFLITGLIQKDLDADNFSLISFWRRRIRRIIPAATVVALVTLVVGSFLLIPSDLIGLAKSAIAQQLMVANVFFWLNSGYFDGAAETMPLLHTWSLAVEEQFYLGFPFLLIFLKKLPKVACVGLLLMGAVVSLVASQWGVTHAASATFYLLPTRMFELILGALLVFTKGPSSGARMQSEILSWLGLFGIITAGCLYDSSTKFPGIAALLPCMGTALIIYANTSVSTLLSKLLSTRPVVFIGLISYSLYLWHWPVLAFLRYWLGYQLEWEVVCGALACSFVLAYLSWRFVETPFRGSGLRGQRFRHLVMATALSALTVVVFCGVLIKGDGFPSRLPKRAQVYLEFKTDYLEVRRSAKQITNGDFPLVGVLSAGKTPDFLIWGDSHAGVLAGNVDKIALELDLRGTLVSVGGQPPLLGIVNKNCEADAAKINQAVLRYISESSVSNVILVGSWRSYLDVTTALVYDEGSERGDKAAAKVAFANGLRRSLDFLTKKGIRVWLVKQVPHQNTRPTLTVVRSVYLGESLPHGISKEEHLLKQKRANNIIDEVAAEYSNVIVLDPAASFFDDDEFSIIADAEGIYYRDEGHMSYLGVKRLLSPMLKNIFMKISTTRSHTQ